MATLKSVSDEILSDLNSFSSQVARKVGSDLHSIILDRVFTRGIATDGAKIGTYTPTTISIKKSKGRFTSKNVNLRDTDTLANSYTFSTKGDAVDLGFRSASRGGVSNSDKIEKLESQYGELFGLTNNEVSEIDGIIEDFLNIKIK